MVNAIFTPGHNATSPVPGAKPSGATRFWSKPGAQFHPTAGVQLLNANLDYYEPFFVSKAFRVTDLAIEVTTAGAGLARIGIYAADQDWQPTTRVMDAGTVDISTTGVKTITGLTVDLPTGAYLAVVNSNVDAQTRAYRGAGVGLLSTLGTNAIVYQIYAARTHAAFPATPVQWNQSSGAGVGFNHTILLRGAPFTVA